MTPTRILHLTASGVKSRQIISKTSLPGMEAFSKGFAVKKKLLVGSHGIPLEEFLCVPMFQRGMVSLKHRLYPALGLKMD